MTVERIEEYISYLLKEKDKVNIISKTVSYEEVQALVEDTKLLEKHVKNKEVVDVGSGNGILGVPLAIMDIGRTVHLVEPRKKKAEFLRKLKSDLKIENVQVYEKGIEEFIKFEKNKKITMVSRGFHDIGILYSIFKKKNLSQILLISSMEKCKRLMKSEKIKTALICDIKNRDVIKKREGMP